MSFFKKNLKNLSYPKSQVFCFFKSARRVCYHLYFNLIKTAHKDGFCSFELKNSEVIENSSKAPLNSCPLKCLYLGKNSFQFH